MQWHEIGLTSCPHQSFTLSLTLSAALAQLCWPRRCRRRQVNENVRGKDVYLVQPTCPPGVNDQLMELLLMVSTMRRASAMKITAVIPY